MWEGPSGTGTPTMSMNRIWMNIDHIFSDPVSSPRAIELRIVQWPYA